MAGKYSPRIGNEKNKGSVIFSQSSLKMAAKYLLHNYFFQLVKKIYTQVIGISMGSDPATFLQIFFFIIRRTDR